jgi:predicted O-linked N-acetylglucosamine transferase (SPINDLY family)
MRKKPSSTYLSGVTSAAANPMIALQAGKTKSLTLDELIQVADALQKQNKKDEIDKLYGNWLTEADSPYKFVACFNYGVLLASWGRDEEAAAQYRRAIEINPLFAQAKINLGLTLERQAKQAEAIAQWEEVANSQQIRDTVGADMQTLALNHIGRVLEAQRNYAAAEAALAKSLDINGNQKDALHHWFHLRQKQCKWPVVEALPKVSENQIINAMSPLAALAFDDDPAFQMHVADKIVREKFTFSVPTLSEQKSYGHAKLRIGYLSADLCTHAVGLLLPELFELHDRSRFGIYAYDYSREDGSVVRQRFKNSIENFRSITAVSDRDAALAIREDEIDILIDLHGLSLGTRPAILAQRPAPIQMTYLGYIGTTMMPYLDYVITDRYCFHRDLEKYFSEKPLLIDHCCLPTDRHRTIDPKPTKAEVGLPEDKFIFATFNNSYKLNETMFACWMRILQRLPNSVLWIVDDNPWATENLKAFAVKSGVSEQRLIFTPRVFPSAYLSRMQLIDVFLDNHPYNAGSTASDVLWMGTPMVTMSGKTFVSRMAGSMLFYSGLPELIAHNHKHYEDIAVWLHDHPEHRQRIHQTLLDQRAPGKAFDMNRFTRMLEQRYQSVAFT